MRLEDIRKMAQEDSVIDDTELDLESLKLPQLHNKYLNIYHDEKLFLLKNESDLKKAIRIKWEYYTGKLDKDSLQELGLEPFPLKILKQDLDKYLESDDDITELNHKYIYQKEKVDYLASVLKELTNRHWKIRNAIEWRKFVSGV
tara:strand:- start:140 stop:574 length:435 start_codon:yes stop_codon:yes gene_type:complete